MRRGGRISRRGGRGRSGWRSGWFFVIVVVVSWGVFGVDGMGPGWDEKKGREIRRSEENDKETPIHT